MSDLEPSTSVVPRPVWARHTRRNEEEALAVPTDEERRDAILVLRDCDHWSPQELLLEAQRIVDDASQDGAFHLLRVVALTDEYRDYELVHLPTCPAHDDGFCLSYECAEGAWLAMDGWEALCAKRYLEELPPGDYPVEAWHQPGGWAGSIPIDPEGGLRFVW